MLFKQAALLSSSQNPKTHVLQKTDNDVSNTTNTQDRMR